LILYRSLALYSSRHFFSVYYIIRNLKQQKENYKKIATRGDIFFWEIDREMCCSPPTPRPLSICLVSMCERVVIFTW